MLESRIAPKQCPHITAPLPGEVDVTVVGGGVIGVFTAWALQNEGLKVLLLEKGRIAAEQSSRNWGWIRQQGRDFAELPIMIDSIPMWNGLSSGIKEKIGYSQNGITYLARDQAAMHKHEQWLDGAKGSGVDSRMLSKREIKKLFPDSYGWIGALTTPSDATAEPVSAVPVIAKAAAVDGVIFREHCAVRALDIRSGAIEGVFTEHGRVKCDRVIIAAGAWSSLLLRQHGMLIPQLSVRASVFSTHPMRNFYNSAAADDRLAFRRRMDGSYVLATWATRDFFIGPDAFKHFRAYIPQIRNELASTRLKIAAPTGFPDAWTTPRRWNSEDKSPFENCRILDPSPNSTDLKYIKRLFALSFPHQGELGIKKSWAGMIDTMPDALPIVGAGPIAGVTIVTGMSGHGFGIAPGIAAAVADIAQLRISKYDLRAFSYSRFQ
ncbi:hypothetical protein BFW87_00655 [Pseudomonas fluorescens]|uniref:FAD dependent oxidoreductase domain-containing protein n=1 Tax=Pseudomonas fluorescens TaxID=294 RepID=A0A1T2ZA25_PSEFL|nr:FAD-binding oxidoreductase [Pseudomonas fluorescens]OPB00948.1 hypothetical protein BFW87_00655 [Pseudomonas fluorescens]